MGLGPLQKKPQRASCSFLYVWSQESAISEPKRKLSPAIESLGALILDFLASWIDTTTDPSEWLKSKRLTTAKLVRTSNNWNPDMLFRGSVNGGQPLGKTFGSF